MGFRFVGSILAVIGMTIPVILFSSGAVSARSAGENAAIHAYYNNSGARSEAAKSAGERRKEKGARLADMRNKRDGLQKDVDDLKRKLGNPELETSERERLKGDLARKEGELSRTDADYASEKKEYGRLRAEEGKINAEDATRKIEENKGKWQQYDVEQKAVVERQNEVKEALKSPDLPPEERKALKKEERELDRRFSRTKSAKLRIDNESRAARGIAEEEWNAYTNNTTKMMNEKRSRVDEIDLEMSAIRDKWKTSTDMMRDPEGAMKDQDRIVGLQKERNGLGGALANYKSDAERTAKKTGLGLEGFGDIGAQNTRDFGIKKSERTLGKARQMAADGLDNSEELLSGLSYDPRYKATIDDLRAKNPGARGKELVDRLVEAAERNKTGAYDAGMGALLAANDPDNTLSGAGRKKMMEKYYGESNKQSLWGGIADAIGGARPDLLKPREASADPLTGGNLADGSEGRSGKDVPWYWGDGSEWRKKVGYTARRVWDGLGDWGQVGTDLVLGGAAMVKSGGIGMALAGPAGGLVGGVVGLATYMGGKNAVLNAGLPEDEGPPEKIKTPSDYFRPGLSDEMGDIKSKIVANKRDAKNGVDGLSPEVYKKERGVLEEQLRNKMAEVDAGFYKYSRDGVPVAPRERSMTKEFAKGFGEGLAFPVTMALEGGRGIGRGFGTIKEGVEGGMWKEGLALGGAEMLAGAGGIAGSAAMLMPGVKGALQLKNTKTLNVKSTGSPGMDVLLEGGGRRSAQGREYTPLAERMKFVEEGFEKGGRIKIDGRDVDGMGFEELQNSLVGAKKITRYEKKGFDKALSDLTSTEINPMSNNFGRLVKTPLNAFNDAAADQIADVLPRAAKGTKDALKKAPGAAKKYVGDAWDGVWGDKPSSPVGTGAGRRAKRPSGPMGKDDFWEVQDGLFGKTFSRDGTKTAINEAAKRGVDYANKAAEAKRLGRVDLAEHWEKEVENELANIDDAVRAARDPGKVYDFGLDGQNAITRHLPGTHGPPVRAEQEIYNPRTGETNKRPSPAGGQSQLLFKIDGSNGKKKIVSGKEHTPEVLAGDPVKGFTPKYRELVRQLGEAYKSGRASSRRVADAIDNGDVQSAINNSPDAMMALSEMDRLRGIGDFALPAGEKAKFSGASEKASGRIRAEVSPHRKIGSKGSPPPDGDLGGENTILDYDPVNEVSVVRDAKEHVRYDDQGRPLERYSPRVRYNEKGEAVGRDGALQTSPEYLAWGYKSKYEQARDAKSPRPTADPESLPWPSFEQQQADLAAEISSAKPLPRGLPRPASPGRVRQSIRDGTIDQGRANAIEKAMEVGVVPPDYIGGHQSNKLASVGGGPPRSRLPDPMSKEQLRDASRSGDLSRMRDQAKQRIGEPPPRGRNSVEELQEFIRQKSPGRSDRFSPSEDVSSRGPPRYEFFEDPSAPMGLGSRKLVSAGDRSAPRASADRSGGEKNPGKSGFQDEWGQRTPRDLMEGSRVGESARRGTNIDRNSPTTKQDYEADADGHLLSIGKTTNIGLKGAQQAKDPTLTTAQRRTAQKNYQISQEKLGRWEESPDVGEVAFKARTGLEKHRPTEKLPGDILKDAAPPNGGRLERGMRVKEAVDVPDAEALPQLADGRYARDYITDYGKNVKIGKDGKEAVRIKDLRRPATDRGKHPGAFRDVNPDNVISVESLSREQIDAAKEANMGFKGKSIERRAKAVDDAVGGRSSKNEPLVSVGKEGTFERGAKVEPPVEPPAGKAGSTRKGKGSGLIPKETLDDIQRDYSVEQVLADHGIGKAENKKYAIRGERTPSVSKLPRGNLVYDHGTGKTYNPITLEAELSGVSYGEAAKRLLEKRPVVATNGPSASAGKPPAPPPAEITTGQREVIAKVRDAANKQLRNAKTPDAAAARKHLADRGITPEEIARNKLGIMPENVTPEKLAKGTGLSVDQLRDAGFVAKSSKGNDYVTLKGRITIPKGDYGMEGRTTKEVTVKNPKYKSLKDLPKREAGIEEISGEEVVITEGTFKKMALERAGAENVLATSGSTKPDRLMAELKAKGVKKVRIVSDPDVAGFEKSDGLEKAARKAGLDPSRHDFAKPGDVEKGYDVERYLVDGGSLEKIGLKPAKSAAGEKASRSPPGKGGKLVSTNEVSSPRRSTPDRREARVDQTGAEKRSLQKAVDDLSNAREEMVGVGSEEAATRAYQKIESAKKNLIATMRDPNVKASLTKEELASVNSALREPRDVTSKSARSRAPPAKGQVDITNKPPVDPYSKAAREYANANPGKVGPGAAPRDGLEFNQKLLDDFAYDGHTSIGKKTPIGKVLRDLDPQPRLTDAPSSARGVPEPLVSVGKKSKFDPYSKEAADMQRRNPGKYGPGAAGKDAPEFIEGELAQYSKEIGEAELRTKQFRRKVEVRTPVATPRLSRDPGEVPNPTGAYDVRSGKRAPLSSGYEKTVAKLESSGDKLADKIRKQEDIVRNMKTGRRAPRDRIQEEENTLRTLKGEGFTAPIHKSAKTTNPASDNVLRDIRRADKALGGTGNREAYINQARRNISKLSPDEIDAVKRELSPAERKILDDLRKAPPAAREGSVGAARADDQRVFSTDNLVKEADGRVFRTLENGEKEFVGRAERVPNLFGGEDLKIIPVKKQRSAAEQGRTVNTANLARLKNAEVNQGQGVVELGNEAKYHWAADEALAGTKKASLKGKRGTTMAKTPLPEFTDAVLDKRFVYAEPGEQQGPTTLRQMAEKALRNRGGEFPIDLTIEDVHHEYAATYSALRTANRSENEILKMTNTGALKQLRVSEADRGPRKSKRMADKHWSLDDPLPGENLTRGGSVRSKKYNPERDAVRSEAQEKMKPILEEIGREEGLGNVTVHDIEVIRRVTDRRQDLKKALEEALKEFRDITDE